MEELDQRRHLSATLLSAYWPLTQGSTWQYIDVDDGKRSTSTETIARGTEAANGERAFQRVNIDENGRTTSLENSSRTGQVQIHASRGTDGSIKFHAGFAYPKFASPGVRSSSEGKVDMIYKS